jgi:hypothetical protein
MRSPPDSTVAGLMDNRIRKLGHGEKRRRVQMAIIEISCVEVWREISNYLDEEISTEMRERMEAHFKECAHCKAVLDGTRNVVGLVGDGKLFHTPEGFNKRLYNKIRSLP